MPSAVFLDRDDTLTNTTDMTRATRYPGDLVDPEHVALMPGAADACRRLVEAGFILIGVSNQACVARGHADLAAVHAVNNRIFELLASHEAPAPADAPAHPHVSRPSSPCWLQAIYFCPYHPDAAIEAFRADHDWRKPAPGMILAAKADFDFDLDASWLIGDARRDVDAGVGAGLRPDRCLQIGGSPYVDLAAAADHLLRSIDA